MKKQIPLEKAQHLAEHIVSELTEYCTQIEIAGSIRRCRPTVGDIDIVALPKDRIGFLKRIEQNSTIIAKGIHNIEIELANGFQVDIYVATPEQKDLFQTQKTNYGSLLLCRTGSKDFNIWLASHTITKRYKWNPYFGIWQAGRCLASETEEDIFKCLSLDFIKPEDRER